MKVGTKLAGAFGLQVAILVGVLYYHVGVIRDSVETSYELSGISERVFVFSTEQLVRIDQLEEYASKYVVTQDAGYLEKFHQVAAEFEQVLRTVADEELGGRERAELARLEASWAAFRETVATLPVLPRGIPPAAAEAAWAPLREHLDRLEADTRSAGDAFQAAMVASLEGSAAAARAAERISWTAAGIALLTSVLISALIVRYISDSLNRLKQGTREVASGNFAYRLDTRRSDEFAQVARDFNAMTERLAELDRMKRDFVSKVSHDLKTPLASMLETVNILLDEVPGPLTEKQRRLLVLNEQSGRRLSSMIAKLLDLSRLEAGALEPELRMHDLGALVQQAIDHFEPATRERGIRITGPGPLPNLLLECDAERIRQVLDNLLENALKFSPGGSTVEVSVKYLTERPESLPPSRWSALRPRDSGAGTVLIAVADAGPGIPDAEKDLVFERFYQTAVGRAARSRGVGLGLTICREIVVAHGGVIWADDGPGRGAVFNVLLPGALRLPDHAVVAHSSRHGQTERMKHAI